VWLSGLGVYAEVLDDSKLYAVGKRELAKEKIIKGSGICLGFLVVAEHTEPRIMPRGLPHAQGRLLRDHHGAAQVTQVVAGHCAHAHTR
jgi:hypothetical protein